MRCHAYGRNISGELTMRNVTRSQRQAAGWNDESGLSRREALCGYLLIAGLWAFGCAGLTWLAGVLL